jgi:hypothetical protein
MNNTADFQEARVLNAEEFMRTVVALTPAFMADINGIVNVDMVITLDDTGRIASIDSVRCNTIVGKPVKPDQPEIIQAANRVVHTLRFLPARRAGMAVARPGVDLSFGFTTAALAALPDSNPPIH